MSAVTIVLPAVRSRGRFNGPARAALKNPDALDRNRTARRQAERLVHQYDRPVKKPTTEFYGRRPLRAAALRTMQAEAAHAMAPRPMFRPRRRPVAGLTQG